MSVPTANRLWATSSLVAALVWLVFAVLPVPGTTVLGLPFGFYAVITGLSSFWDRRKARDRVGARRAGWGVGLGCAGFVIGFALDFLLAGAIVAALIAAIRVALGVHL